MMFRTENHEYRVWRIMQLINFARAFHYDFTLFHRQRFPNFPQLDYAPTMSN